MRKINFTTLTNGILVIQRKPNCKSNVVSLVEAGCPSYPITRYLQIEDTDCLALLEKTTVSTLIKT